LVSARPRRRATSSSSAASAAGAAVVQAAARRLPRSCRAAIHAAGARLFRKKTNFTPQHRPHPPAPRVSLLSREDVLHEQLARNAVQIERLRMMASGMHRY